MSSQKDGSEINAIERHNADVYWARMREQYGVGTDSFRFLSDRSNPLSNPPLAEGQPGDEEASSRAE